VYIICPEEIRIYFSIAMNGTEARLYVIRKQDEPNYYMANFRRFLLHNHDHYVAFRKDVRNILDWGKGNRLIGVYFSKYPKRRNNINSKSDFQTYQVARGLNLNDILFSKYPFR